MIKKITKHDIEHILKYPQYYVDENTKEDLVSVDGSVITLVCNPQLFTQYYFTVKNDYEEFDALYPGYLLSDAYRKLLVGILEDIEDLSKMSYFEFSKYLSNKPDRFQLILDYEYNFFVYMDKKTGRYYYLECPESDTSDFFEVYPVAVLNYTAIHDIRLKNGEELSRLFDCCICGEEVTDEKIRYWWFERKENNV